MTLSDFRLVASTGQPMTISYYTAPRAPRRIVSAPSSTTRSLLNKVEKPPLSDRLTKEEADAKLPSGPQVVFPQIFCTSTDTEVLYSDVVSLVQSAQNPPAEVERQVKGLQRGSNRKRRRNSTK